MSGRRWVIGCLAAVLLLAGCQERNEWRQKLTVEVETPQGIRSGEAVAEVEARFGQLPLSAVEVNYSYRSEATVVEVAPGKYLFALLGGTEERFYRALGYNYSDRGGKLKRIARMQGERRVLSPNNYPLLVTFADIADPKTVQRVDPDDLAASFGESVALQSITLEITDEKVTEGRIEQVLGWLPDIWPNQLDGQRYETIRAENRFANSLSTGSFTTEAFK